MGGSVSNRRNAVKVICQIEARTSQKWVETNIPDGREAAHSARAATARSAYCELLLTIVLRGCVRGCCYATWAAVAAGEACGWPIVRPLSGSKNCSRLVSTASSTGWPGRTVDRA